MLGDMIKFGDLMGDLLEGSCDKGLFHTYYLTVTLNLNNEGERPYKIKNDTFTRRTDAEREMYKIADSFGVGRLNKIEDDIHFKTYIGENANWIKFQINRE